MAKGIALEKSSDREKNWDKIFMALVKLLKDMEKDKEYCEERIIFLQEALRKMELEQKLEVWKGRQILGFMEREAYVYRLQCEDVADIMADFQELTKYLSQKCVEPKDGPDNISGKMGSQRNRSLQEEVRSLKSELEGKNTEISALLSQKNFIWNQFNKMENDLNNQLKKKCSEAEHANAKVHVLVKRAEELEYSNEKLRTDFARMESEKVEMSQEISRLLKEIEHLKSGSGSATPVLRGCKTETGPSQRVTRNNTSHGRDKDAMKEPSTSRTFERMDRTKPYAHKSTGGTAPRKKLGVQVDGSSKRKAVNAITVDDDTPKLFTSSFKVPKLKSAASPRVI